MDNPTYNGYHKFPRSVLGLKLRQLKDSPKHAGP
jgi:hypothetical protein